MKGFSAKLKVLKDCNQIKGFKGSTRGAVIYFDHCHAERLHRSGFKLQRLPADNKSRSYQGKS